MSVQPQTGIGMDEARETLDAMADGNWTLASDIDEQADGEQTAALGPIFGGAEAGSIAAFAPLVDKHLGVKKVGIKYAINGNTQSAEITRYHAHGGGTAGEHAPER
jgi:hypothetical protein